MQMSYALRLYHCGGSNVKYFAEEQLGQYCEVNRYCNLTSLGILISMILMLFFMRHMFLRFIDAINRFIGVIQ